jgi:predicted alpha/beta superfamily hydrolase
MLVLSFASTAQAEGQTPPPRQQTLTGEFRAHPKFHSKFLPADRDVLVYLPPGYDRDRSRRYPVLYMHDGQNLFDGSTSFIPGMEWRVDETAQALIESGAIEPLIIVGIYNTGNLRVDEYTPTADARYKAGGKAALYGRLIVEELKPFIDARYRTRREASATRPER